MTRLDSLIDRLLRRLWRWHTKRLNRGISAPLNFTAQKTLAHALDNTRMLACRDRRAKGQCLYQKERTTAP